MLELWCIKWAYNMFASLKNPPLLELVDADMLVGVYLDAVATSDVIFDATPPPGQHISLASKISGYLPTTNL